MFFEIFKKVKNSQETTEIKNLKEKIQNSKKKILKTDLSYYIILKQIGKGAFGKVYLSLQKLTNRLVAIKILKKKNKIFLISEKILNEIKILKKLNFEKNVVKLLEVFENDEKVFLVMEYCNKGNLLSWLKKKKNLEKKIQNFENNLKKNSEKKNLEKNFKKNFGILKIKKIFYKICKSISSLHNKNIIHRDIKLDNILLDEFSNPKICDFGVSKILKQNEKINEKCGTPAYLAPEIINEISNFGFKSDIWSLGILLFFMIYNKMPFEAASVNELKLEMSKKKFVFEGNFDEVQVFLEKVLVFDMEKRLSILEVLQDQFFFDVTNDIDKTNGGPHDFYKNEISKGGPHDFYQEDFKFCEEKINLFILDCLIDYGYDKENIINSLKFKKLNHITACYYNLVKDYIT